ncbi:MAG: undecaprenyl-diphosphatase UppP [Fimbriimonadaceae bacterium]|nr:MAG: undecaprenyl-diphosphatase UppP [Fimbriimonadaceae bacterium]
MGILEAIVLGIVQGLTEFLPISSSGHLYLIPPLFGWKDAGAGFTAVIQLGTMLAVFIYFWDDITSTYKGWTKGFKDKESRGQEWRLGWGIFWGSFPIAILGLALEKQIDTVFRDPYLIAGTLAGFGLLLGLSDWKGKRDRDLEQFTIKDGIIMGLWQCLALFPGSSRSGSTITGGLFGGFNRATAARVSFLLAIPSVTASGLYKLYKGRSELFGEGLVPTLVATGVSFLVGWWAIAFLMKFLQSKSTTVFVVYRVVLAAVIVFVASQNILDFSGTAAMIAPLGR